MGIKTVDRNEEIIKEALNGLQNLNSQLGTFRLLLNRLDVCTYMEAKKTVDTFHQEVMRVVTVLNELHTPDDMLDPEDKAIQSDSSKDPDYSIS